MPVPINNAQKNGPKPKREISDKEITKVNRGPKIDEFSDIRGSVVTRTSNNDNPASAKSSDIGRIATSAAPTPARSPTIMAAPPARYTV